MRRCIRGIQSVALILSAVTSLLGCAGRRQGAPAPPEATTDTGGVPPGCSPLHGGIAATPPAPPLWRRGAALGPNSSDSVSLVILQVVSARDGAPVEEARVLLGPSTSVSRQAVTRVTGYAVARVTPGRMQVRVFRLGFQRYADTVTIRGGYADTLQLGLGIERICYM